MNIGNNIPVEKIKENAHFYIAIILSCTFLFSSFSKMYYWQDTRHAIMSIVQSAISYDVSIILAPIVILTELALAVLFLFPKYWKHAGLACLIIISIFTIVVFWGKSQNIITACKCFGNFFGSQIGPVLLVRNILIVALSLYLFFRSKIANSFDEINLLVALKYSSIILVVVNFLFIGRIISIAIKFR